MKPFVILRPKTDLFEPLPSLSAWLSIKPLKSRYFFKDRPVNQKSYSWKIFRLSISRMATIADHSTHVRATCNFYTDGLNYTDYLTAKLSEVNVTDYARIDKCNRFEYIDIRGYVAAIAPLILFFKAVNGTHTLTLIMDYRKDAGVLYQELLEKRVKMTLELIKQSILNTDARQMTIPPHSGGLENSRTLSLSFVHKISKR